MFEIVHRRFKVKSRKKAWIFYCNNINCNSKISTDTHTHYFTLRGYLDETWATESKYCSEECAETGIEKSLLFLFLHEVEPNRGVYMLTERLKLEFDEWRKTREAEVCQVRYVRQG